jgi:hypothetical protein
MDMLVTPHGKVKHFAPITSLLHYFIAVCGSGPYNRDEKEISNEKITHRISADGLCRIIGTDGGRDCCNVSNSRIYPRGFTVSRRIPGKGEKSKETQKKAEKNKETPLTFQPYQFP